MAAPRFLNLVAGIRTQLIAAITATADSIVGTKSDGTLDATFMPGGSPVNSSAGAGDAGKLPKLDSAGRLDSSMMPVGVTPEAEAKTASETIAASAIVNVWNSSGTPKARNADATAAGKEATGFVQAGIANAASGTVFVEGIVTGLSGLTPGATYYLSTTPGAITVTPPSGSGNILQVVGVALSTTTLSWAPGEPTTLA